MSSADAVQDRWILDDNVLRASNQTVKVPDDHLTALQAKRVKLGQHDTNRLIAASVPAPILAGRRHSDNFDTKNRSFWCAYYPAIGEHINFMWDRTEEKLYRIKYRPGTHWDDSFTTTSHPLTLTRDTDSHISQGNVPFQVRMEFSEAKSEDARDSVAEIHYAGDVRIHYHPYGEEPYDENDIPQELYNENEMTWRKSFWHKFRDNQNGAMFEEKGSTATCRIQTPFCTLRLIETGSTKQWHFSNPLVDIPLSSELLSEDAHLAGRCTTDDTVLFFVDRGKMVMLTFAPVEQPFTTSMTVQHSTDSHISNVSCDAKLNVTVDGEEKESHTSLLPYVMRHLQSSTPTTKWHSNTALTNPPGPFALPADLNIGNFTRDTKNAVTPPTPRFRNYLEENLAKCFKGDFRTLEDSFISNTVKTVTGFTNGGYRYGKGDTIFSDAVHIGDPFFETFWGGLSVLQSQRAMKLISDQETVFKNRKKAILKFQGAGQREDIQSTLEYGWQQVTKYRNYLFYLNANMKLQDVPPPDLTGVTQKLRELQAGEEKKSQDEAKRKSQQDETTEQTRRDQEEENQKQDTERRQLEERNKQDAKKLREQAAADKQKNADKTQQSDNSQPPGNQEERKLVPGALPGPRGDQSRAEDEYTIKSNWEADYKGYAKETAQEWLVQLPMTLPWVETSWHKFVVAPSHHIPLSWLSYKYMDHVPGHWLQLQQRLWTTNFGETVYTTDATLCTPLVSQISSFEVVDDERTSYSETLRASQDLAGLGTGFWHNYLAVAQAVDKYARRQMKVTDRTVIKKLQEIEYSGKTSITYERLGAYVETFPSDREDVTIPFDVSSTAFKTELWIISIARVSQPIAHLMTKNEYEVLFAAGAVSLPRKKFEARYLVHVLAAMDLALRNSPIRTIMPSDSLPQMLVSSVGRDNFRPVEKQHMMNYSKMVVMKTFDADQYKSFLRSSGIDLTEDDPLVVHNGQVIRKALFYRSVPWTLLPGLTLWKQVLYVTADVKGMNISDFVALAMGTWTDTFDGDPQYVVRNLGGHPDQVTKNIVQRHLTLYIICLCRNNYLDVPTATALMMNGLLARDILFCDRQALEECIRVVSMHRNAALGYDSLTFTEADEFGKSFPDDVPSVLHHEVIDADRKINAGVIYTNFTVVPDADSLKYFKQFKYATSQQAAYLWYMLLTNARQWYYKNHG